MVYILIKKKYLKYNTKKMAAVCLLAPLDKAYDKLVKTRKAITLSAKSCQFTMEESVKTTKRHKGE